MFARRKGREADGVELALKHLDSLYAAALRLTRDSSYAEDLVQEAFLRGYRYYRRLTVADECKALLYKIMLNLWRKDRRRAHREVSLNDSAGARHSEDLGVEIGRPGSSENPETEVMKKHFLMAVDQALRKLPADLQVTVILADIEGFTYQEMATILQRPLGTVMSRLHRARRCLEQAMNAFAESAGGEKAPR
jgi:RNA polymerase sigma-70 factor (ECF subfamily)